MYGWQAGMYVDEALVFLPKQMSSPQPHYSTHHGTQAKRPGTAASGIGRAEFSGCPSLRLPAFRVRVRKVNNMSTACSASLTSITFNLSLFLAFSPAYRNRLLWSLAAILSTGKSSSCGQRLTFCLTNCSVSHSRCPH